MAEATAIAECSVCHKTYDASGFRASELAKSKAKAKAKPLVCRLCHRDAYYVRTYGASTEKLERLVAAQGHRCPICQRAIVLGTKTHVDHDHVTGQLRGVLCSRCNPILSTHMNYQLLQRAATYLQIFEICATAQTTLAEWPAMWAASTRVVGAPVTTPKAGASSTALAFMAARVHATHCSLPDSKEPPKG